MAELKNNVDLGQTQNGCEKKCMKKNRLVTLATVCFVATTLFLLACSKISNQLTDDTFTYTKTNEVKKTRQAVGPYVELKGKLHSYATRKHGALKGADCGCEHCFGVCDFKFRVGWDIGERRALLDIVNNTTGRIYILDPNTAVEDVFMIGGDLPIARELLQGVTSQNVTVLTGDYEYHMLPTTIIYNGAPTATIGYVDVNLSVY
jgi:hypothetical protein